MRTGGGFSNKTRDGTGGGKEPAGRHHAQVWISNYDWDRQWPAFVSMLIQGLASVIGADWKLHCAYHPQSSGQVDRMNRTLKETLS